MGVRFRKSVSICKGLRINFNKNSVGLSVGTKGARVSMNSKGRLTSTVGIPGSGLSYSNSYTIGSNQNNNSTNMQTIQTTIKLHMNKDGKMIFTYADGTEITDTSMINKIKRTEQYKMEKERMQKEHIQEVLNEVNEYNKKNDELINIYKLCAKKINTIEDYINEKNDLKVKTYTRKQYSVEKPSKEDVRLNLLKEAKKQIKSIAFWTLKTKRENYVSSNIENRLNEEIEKWNNDKKQFEEKENNIEKEQNKILQNEFNIQKEYLEKIINGDTEYINQSIENWLSELQMPLEFNVQFEYNHNEKKLGIDLDLPEIEDFPSQKAYQLNSGNFKLKNKNQAEIKKDYATYVFGLALFITSHLLNICPTINNILISAFTQRRDKMGNINDDYIYSINFDRIQFKELDLNNNPYENCMLFQNRCNLSSTNIFRNIIPFDF